MMRKRKFIFVLIVFALSACSGNSSSSTSIASSGATPKVEVYDVVSAIMDSQDSVISNQENYYKVLDLNSSQNYMFGHEEGNGKVLVLSTELGSSFTYTLKSGGGSKSKPSSSFSLNGYELTSEGEKAVLVKQLSGQAPNASGSSSSISNDSSRPQGGEPLGAKKGLWDYSEGKLSFTLAGETKYLLYKDSSFVFSSSYIEGCEVDLFTSGEILSSCIASLPEDVPYIDAADFVAPSIEVTLKEGVSLSKASWYLEGELQEETSLSFSPSSLSTSGTGVYPVYVSVEGRDEKGYYYKETSYPVNVVIANGVIKDSVFTFSDCHEEYSLMGDAIEEIMKTHNGAIPSLIVATGDFVNGATPVDEVIHNYYLPRIKAQFGGIDTIYVAGNHESYLSLANASIDAHLGANEDCLDGLGLLFDSSSEDKSQYGRSSLYTSNLLVYGISYFALEEKLDSGELTYNYSRVLTDLRSFLDSRVSTYNGELILLSAHAGLHTLGFDPHSSCTTAFAGNNEYNLDLSSEVVKLVNEYATNYNMNFAFLFGHNHSKSEAEFILAPGERIYSTSSFANKEVENLPLEFSYGNAGYLSSSIGSAAKHYTFIDYDDSSYSLHLKELGGTTLTTVISKR